MSRNTATSSAKAIMALVAVAAAPLLFGDPEDHPTSELIGLWKGTSVCTDLVAAPACKDEVVVYEFTAVPDDPAKVHWKADKVVDGQRLNMGAFDLAWDDGDACWRGEYRGPRIDTVWCVTVKAGQLTGSGWLLPGKKTVRKLDAHRDFGEQGPRKR